jgi:hypothetical protein
LNQEVDFDTCKLKEKKEKEKKKKKREFESEDKIIFRLGSLGLDFVVGKESC